MGQNVMSCFEAFAGDPYPGRGIVAGMDEKGENLVQVYWIMGRSENSRNRVFKQEKGRVWTEAADPSRVKDGSLIFYNAMREVRTNGQIFAVTSNGNQTDTAAEAIPRTLADSLMLREYEPDNPNYTPRITAVSRWCGRAHVDQKWITDALELSSLRKTPGRNACERHSHFYENVEPGIGYCLTTYEGDGDPLPSYAGEPYALLLRGDARKIAESYAKALNESNFVSLAVKFVPKRGESLIVIVNKYAQVSQKITVVQ